jgi:hypothetical protein
MVERQLPKLNVAGSSPVFRSNKKKPPVEMQEAFSYHIKKCVTKSPLSQALLRLLRGDM